MLVFLYIFIFFVFINLVLFFSNIILEIEKIEIDTTKQSILNDLKINLYIAFLNKINYMKISLDIDKILKMKDKEKIKKIKEKIINFKQFKQFKDKGLIKNTGIVLNTIKKINLKLERLELTIDLGLENVTILAYIVTFLNVVISILLGKKTFCEYKPILKNYNFIIIPKHVKNNYMKSNIKAQINIKISNIVKNIL